MSDEVLVAWIGFAAVVCAGLISAVLAPLLLRILGHVKSAAKSSAETRDATVNSHDSNLRDDVDVLIVGLDTIQEALGIEDTLVRTARKRIRERKPHE